MVSAEAIEAALYTAFTGDGKLVRLEIGKSSDSIVQPAINFAVTGGDFEDPGLKTSTIMQKYRITAEVACKNVRTDAESYRRAEAHPLILWVLQKLWLNTLGLTGLKPILIERWHETTTMEQLAIGVFQAEISASARAGMDRLDDGQQKILLQSILSGFTLPESAAPSVPVAELDLTLQESP